MSVTLPGKKIAPLPKPTPTVLNAALAAHSEVSFTLPTIPCITLPTLPPLPTLPTICTTTTTIDDFALAVAHQSNRSGLVDSIPCGPHNPNPTTTTSSTTTTPSTTTTTVFPTTTTRPPVTAPPTTGPVGTIPSVTTPAVTTPPGPTTTTNTTTPPTTVLPTTTPTTTAPPPNPALALDHHSLPPGGSVTASGRGCTPNSPVQLLIDSVPAGNTTANRDGTFSAPLTVSVPIGQHTVTALCGPTLLATLDVVLTSQAGVPTSTAAILLLGILLLLAVARWQLSNR